MLGVPYIQKQPQECSALEFEEVSSRLILEYEKLAEVVIASIVQTRGG